MDSTPQALPQGAGLAQQGGSTGRRNERCKALVIENDMSIADGIEDLLLGEGVIHVMKARSEQEAVDAALMVGPDLVIADFALDGPMDGLRALCRIERHSAKPFVTILVTALGVEVEQTAMLRFVPKNAEGARLHREIRLALQRLSFPER